MTKSSRAFFMKIRWKDDEQTFVGVGIALLISGTICVLYGYLASRNNNQYLKYNSYHKLLEQQHFLNSIDKMRINEEMEAEVERNLEICKLVGLILFCFGGLTLAVALMIPSFLYRYLDEEEEDDDEDEKFLSEFNEKRQQQLQSIKSNNNSAFKIFPATDSESANAERSSIPMLTHVAEIQPIKESSGGIKNGAFD
ncbi:hypothetical protein HELRODRAFT_161095 [Helobdella robusta]|uniref:Uncharacterized protein n=1 Tax=Helobdella robusta TaxID=6412 RepID=T1ER36_HELRO|nr:hypothetical protein HELRODRAFT_161095 [Helobdella robusta]ESO01902.1 hypothetical protein HELRODRAFT_161095 [Helobdella robusta]